MSFCLKALFAFVTIIFLAHPAFVLAQGGGGGPAGIPLVEYMFARVVCVTVPLGYVALLVVLIIAGFKYLISGGEPKAIAAAHQTVTWGLLGILFLAIAWLILLLIQNFTGVEVTKFNMASLPGVQGFSGQCLGPAPTTPEPVSQSSPPVTIPPTSNNLTCNHPYYIPIFYIADPRRGGGAIPEYDKTKPIEMACYQGNRDPYTDDPLPFCEIINGFEAPVRLCKAIIDCDTIPYYFAVRSGIPNSVYYRTASSMDELALVLDKPRWVNVAPIDAVDENDYCREGADGTCATGTDGTSMAKYKKDQIPIELIRMKIKADNLLLSLGGQLGGARSPVEGFVQISGISCRNADYWGSGASMTFTSNGSMATPLIYLFPSYSIDVSMHIGSPVISSEIKLDNGDFWHVKAEPNGTLTSADNKKYRFIPYEFLRNDFKRPVNGTLIEGSKLEEYLRKDLWKKLGLTDSEINDYWVDTKPRVKPSPYYFISLIDKSEIDRVLPMDVNPKPDTIIRNMTYILPLSAPFTPQPLEKERLKAPERNGFTVLENGVFTDGF